MINVTRFLTHSGPKLSKAQKSKILNKAEKVLLKKSGFKGGVKAYKKAHAGGRRFENLSKYACSACGFSDLAIAATDFQVGHNVGGVAVLGIAAFLRETSLFVHREAIRGSVAVAKILKEEGFKHNEIVVVVKKELSKKGDAFISNLFKVLYPKRVDKIADGIEPRSGFLSLAKFKMPKKKSV